MIYYWLLVILCLLLLFIISLVSSIILYAEQYTTLNIDMIYTILQVVSLWKELPLNSLLFYILLTAGYTILLTSLKVFISVSMMVGNIIDIYLLGVMVVIILSRIISTNHIFIGANHIVLGLIGGSIGFGLSLVMRLELALPGFVVCSPLQYNPAITFHGLFMTLFMIMPILIGGFFKE